MMICSKCKTQFDGNFCPKCGTQANQKLCCNEYSSPCNKTNKPIYKKWWFWIIVVLVILTVLPNTTSYEDDNIGVYTDGIGSNTIIEETLIYSGNDIEIFAKSLKGNSLKLYIENNSNLNLGFNAHSYAINGIMTQESIYAMDCDVSAHSKANTELKISNSFLIEYEIESIEQIDILFWAYDNDKSFKEFETDVITVKTSEFKNNIASISGLEIYNKKGIIVEFLEQENNQFTFCLTNKTGSYFDFTVDNINVNNYTISDIDFDLYDEQILNNCQFVYTIKIDKEFLSNNDIEKISTVSFNFEIEPEGDAFNDWSTDTITYTNKS
jgi:hypothetical protein